jgi:hypothetical protein
MARIRTIKPDFFLNEDISELPAMCRLLFIGLWTQADREGRLQDRPKRLKAAIFPYDNVNIESLLSTLQNAGFIIRYDFGDLKLIQVANFLKHQYPNVKEPQSSLPAIPAENTVQAPYQHHTGILGKEGKGKEGERELESEKAFEIQEMKDELSEAELQPTFEEFWDEYDKKVGEKEKIKKKWAKIPHSEKEKIMEYIPNYKLSQPDKQYRKNPDTFLNNQSWNDELIFKNGKQTTNNSANYNAKDRAAKLYDEYNRQAGSK